MTDREDPKVVPLPKKDEVRASLEELKRNYSSLLEHAAYVAAFKRHYYSQLVQYGFTPEQALELTKHPAVM